jgi:hypothetical protein
MKNLTHCALAALLVSFSASGFSQQTSVPQPVAVVEDVTVATEPVVDPTALEYSNKWRIKFDNRTDSSGELVFLFALQDAQPISISISVAKDLSENDIAKMVENALKKNAPGGIKVERDDGEDVLVKYKHRFSLTLLTNTVTDLDVDLDKE